MINKKSASVPTVINYLDYRVFLADWITAKKHLSPSYSHRLFAKKAGYKNPSLLGLIIKGERNLSDKLFPGFCKAMGLDADQKSTFQNLVLLDRASTLEERTQLIEKILATRRYQQALRIEDAGFLYLSRWYLPAIRELANRKDFCADADWIVKRIRPKITKKDALEALDLLTEMKLIEIQANGTVHQTTQSVVTDHEVASIAVRKYHQEMGKLAIQCLEQKGGKNRHFGAVTALVSPSSISILKKEIAQFQERILSLCDEQENDQTTVIQLNLQLFPMSDPNEESP